MSFLIWRWDHESGEEICGGDRALHRSHCCGGALGGAADRYRNWQRTLRFAAALVVDCGRGRRLAQRAVPTDGLSRMREQPAISATLASACEALVSFSKHKIGRPVNPSRAIHRRSSSVFSCRVLTGSHSTLRLSLISTLPPSTPQVRSHLLWLLNPSYRGLSRHWRKASSSVRTGTPTRVHQEIYPVYILPDPPPDGGLIDRHQSKPLAVGKDRRREGAHGAARIVVLACIARLTFGADLAYLENV